MKITHYCIVRTDVDFGTQCAMLLHAAGESFGKGPPKCRNDSVPIYAVALSARNEAELLLLEEKLIRKSVPHVAFREPDRNNELMAIGIAPMERNKVRPFVSSLPLIR